MARRRYTPPPLDPAFLAFNQEQEKTSSPFRIDHYDGEISLDDLRREADNRAVYVCKCTWPPGAVLEATAFLEGYRERPALQAYLERWCGVVVTD